MTVVNADALLPAPEPRQLIDPDGRLSSVDGPLPPDAVLLDLYHRMVVGRRFDAQATALTKQGRLAVYPSSRGQEACQVGAVVALADRDWLFPDLPGLDGDGQPGHQSGGGADPATR